MRDDPMLKSVVTVRIDKRLVEEIDEIAKKDKSDRAAVLRRIVSDALDRQRLRMAIQMYKDGKITTERAAQMAEVSIHEMIESLRREGVPSQFTTQDIRQDAVSLLRRMGKW